MTGPTDDLARIAALTLDHYERNAEAFWEGTRDHDVSQNIAALLQAIDAPPPVRILDLGCGPGRDLSAFRALGHHAVGLEGAPRLAAMARALSGCPVLEQNFLALELPDAAFDGIFANASLFHVPLAALPRVLRELHTALVPGGVLFASNPRGLGQEEWRSGRFGAFHDLASWQAALDSAGFRLEDHYFRPAGRPCAEQPWLATVSRKTP